MSSIGPQIPVHLLASANDSLDDDNDCMPALPPDLVVARAKAGPSLPPTKGLSSESPPRVSSAASNSAGKEKFQSLILPYVSPPTFPSRSPSISHPDSDSDSNPDFEVGPQPLPSSTHSKSENSAVQEFIEREECRRKNVEEASRPKKLEREEWMIVPPKSGDLLGSLDPTKLKARQFGRGSCSTRDTDSSLWTETPAERQQRLADEVSGRKRRAVNADPKTTDKDPAEARKRRKREEEIRKGVEEHTRRMRGAALVDTHMDREAQKKGGAQDAQDVIWDHARDMSVGGRLMDENQRQIMLRDAKTLGDRFGTGRSGGFL